MVSANSRLLRKPGTMATISARHMKTHLTLMRRLHEANLASMPTRNALLAIECRMNQMKEEGVIQTWAVKFKKRSEVLIGWSIFSSNPTIWVNLDIDLLTPENLLITDVMES